MFANIFVDVFNQNIKRILWTSTKYMACPASTAAVLHKNIDKDARIIFSSAIEAVLPHKMISKHVKFSSKDSLLTVDNVSYKVEQNVYIVGFGKAVCGMACTLNEILHGHIVKGILSIPVGIQQALKDTGKKSLIPDNPRILLCEGAANNLPDNDAYQTTLKIQQLVTSLQKTDILFVLISGGGSALLTNPCPPITIEEETKLTKLLSDNGVTINQLNQVRQNVEILKGGGLARITNANQIISLILSDVIGDKLDKIASGPTVFVPQAPQECLTLFESLKIKTQVPPSVLSVLEAKKLQQNLSTVHERSGKVSNIIVGSNRDATQAAFACANQKGYSSFILTTQLEGEARDLGTIFGKLAELICNKFVGSENCSMEKFPQFFSEKRFDLENFIKAASANQKPICVICGGETTVTVKGNGKGGRNQEMALSTALWLNEEFPVNLKELFHVHFLSAGTDGQDGPTDVAGCSVSSHLVMDSSARSHLENNDTYNYFLSFLDSQCFVKTGLTATNVMDIQLLIIDQLK